jgi:hypothetical protein
MENAVEKEGNYNAKIRQLVLENQELVSKLNHF